MKPANWRRDAWYECPYCRTFCKDLNRHLRRNRCEHQHRRTNIREKIKKAKKEGGWKV